MLHLRMRPSQPPHARRHDALLVTKHSQWASSTLRLLLCRNKCDPTAIWHGADKYQSTFLDTSLLAYHEELSDRLALFVQ